MKAGRFLPMSVADYLAFEETSDVRHESIGGETYALGGGTTTHHRISGNIFASLQTQLHSGPYKVSIEYVTVRLAASREDIFYYPDVVVSCHPTGVQPQFVILPTPIVEVLSPSTATIDRREKKMNDLHVPTLEESVLVAQERREVTFFRRATGWQGEIFTAPESLIEFRSVKQAMTLAAIYEDVAL
jgi:Uma2 family endonuclease